MVASAVRRPYPVRSNKGGVFILILNILIGTATGIISGLGIGGGSLLVLYLTAVKDLSQHAAGGMNLFYFIGCAPAALIGHIRNRRIDWRVVLWCTISGITTAILAAFLAKDIQHEWLRRVFGGILLYIGIRELRAGRKDNE